MKKKFIILIIITTFLVSATSMAADDYQRTTKNLYRKMKLSNKINYKLFENAVTGYEKINSKGNGDFLTIIDFSKPSTEKRFYVLDMKRKRVFYETYVSHGVNTGNLNATKFSNRINSRKSSLGFFLTNETYFGSNGYSLRLDGLEPGINSNARKRAIVIHGADYANPDFIEKTGRLGRSWGCPALPLGLNKEIIDTIKNGTVIFINGNDLNYAQKSKYI